MDIFNKPKSKKFEISLLMRDNFGKTTNIKRSFATDNPEELYNWYSRNSGHAKNKRRGGRAATKGESDKAVKEATSYADDKQQRKHNEEV